MANMYFLLNLFALQVLTVAAIFHPHSDQSGWFYWLLAAVAGAGIASLFALRVELARPPPLIREVGDRIRAMYMPEGEPPAHKLNALVGELLTYCAIMEIDKGLHKGDWAMSPGPSVPGSEAVSVPLSDLVIQDSRRR